MKILIAILIIILASCSPKIVTDAAVQVRLYKIDWVARNHCRLIFKDRKDSTHTVNYKTQAIRTHTFIIGDWYTIRYQAAANRADSCKPVFATIKHNR